MPDDIKNPPIGTDTCHDCGHDCTIRLNKNRKAYYHCPGCYTHHRYNVAKSDEMRIAWAKASNPLTDDVPTEPTEEPGPAGEPANDNAAAEPERRRFGGLLRD